MLLRAGRERRPRGEERQQQQQRLVHRTALRLLAAAPSATRLLDVCRSRSAAACSRARQQQKRERGTERESRGRARLSVFAAAPPLLSLSGVVTRGPPGAGRSDALSPQPPNRTRAPRQGGEIGANATAGAREGGRRLCFCAPARSPERGARHRRVKRTTTIGVRRTFSQWKKEVAGKRAEGGKGEEGGLEEGEKNKPPSCLLYCMFFFLKRRVRQQRRARATHGTRK